ncbi:MAG: glycosyltransferase family 4 protein [Bacteriovoracaceae bacterium]|jgi:glycosyltransferase involved in cell wall biosynthesis|nr:glycosyltransferase family 4 protein [Bacteriovoracaceae bacterium]
MKIGLEAKRAFHNFRGLGIYCRNLITGLAKYHPESEFFLYTPPFKDSEISSFNKLYKNTYIKGPNKLGHKLFHQLWRGWFQTNDLEADQIDIYHGLSHEIPHGIEKTSIKKVVTIHDLIYLKRPDLFPLHDRLVYDHKFRSSAERSDLIVAVSEETKTDLIKHFGIDDQKIKVVYQTCDPAFYENTSSIDKDSVAKKYHLPKDFILFMGALEPRKNALGVLKAWHQIPKDNRMPLVIVGKGKEYKNQIDAYIGRHGLGAEVMVLGNVNRIEGIAVHALATIFVWPSHLEGFGIPLIEAIYSKSAVITSQGGCFEEAAGKGAIYVDPSSQEQITQSLTRLTDSKQLRCEYIDKGLVHVQKFHQENTTKELWKIYNQLR